MPKLTPDTQLSCSQLPALMGYSPYSKPNDVLRTLMDARRGEDVRYQAGEAADWGNALEDRILQEAARRLGLKSWFTPEVAYPHDDLPLAASIDALGEAENVTIEHDPQQGIYVMDGDSITLDGLVILESKLTRNAPENEPAMYRGPIQLQGVMMCSRIQTGVIAVLYGGVQLRLFLYKGHPATQEAIAAAVTELEGRLTTWEESGDPDWYPPADSKDADRVWPQASDTQIDLGEDFEAAAGAIVELRAKIKLLTEQVAKHEATVKSVMQDFGAAKAGRYQITWPMRHYKAAPEKITPAKEAYSVRQSTLTIKEIK
jgi:predicted phage-related endonuclease